MLSRSKERREGVAGREATGSRADQGVLIMWPPAARPAHRVCHRGGALRVAEGRGVCGAPKPYV